MHVSLFFCLAFSNNVLIKFVLCYTVTLLHYSTRLHCYTAALNRFITMAFVELESAQLAVVLIGRLMLTTAFGLIYFYTPEMFPTEVRNSVLGASSTIGRVSGMVAAFIGGPLVNIPALSRLYA